MSARILGAHTSLGYGRSNQHDEFAVVNYYKKVSKYDLDRANLKMRDAWVEKSNRRVRNAAAKKHMIESAKMSYRREDVSRKLSKIKDITTHQTY